MEILRRNTDYALRAMVHMANHVGKARSARQVAEAEEVPYHLACKLLQKLLAAGLVQSKMGSRGGFQLACEPHMITLLQLVNAIQGPLVVNRCLLGLDACPRRPTCPAGDTLIELQEQMERYMEQVTLDQLRRAGPSQKQGQRRHARKPSNHF